MSSGIINAAYTPYSASNTLPSNFNSNKKVDGNEVICDEGSHASCNQGVPTAGWECTKDPNDLTALKTALYAKYKKCMKVYSANAYTNVSPNFNSCADALKPDKATITVNGDEKTFMGVVETLDIKCSDLVADFATEGWETGSAQNCTAANGCKLSIFYAVIPQQSYQTKDINCY